MKDLCRVWMLILLMGWGATAVADTAEEILEATGVRGGLIVHVGCGDGKLTAGLRAGEQFLVQGLDADAANVAKARKHIESLGAYGPVSVDRFDGKQLPYADDLVQLVVAEDLGDVSMKEVLRVLAPKGVAYVNKSGKWTKTVKPWPDDMDDWTHYLHDASGNAVASDSRVGSPRHMRWLAGPRYGRSHEFNPSINAMVSAGGRMFYTLDEGISGLLDSPKYRFPARWSLIGRDAHSGVELWKRPIPDWGFREWNTVGMWSAPLTLQRRLVTDGERVYFTFGYKAPVTVLDAASGKTLQTIEGTDGTDEMILHDGVLLLCVRETLSVAPEGKTGNTGRRRNPHEYTIAAPGPASIVAVDAKSGKELWRRKPTSVTIVTLAAQGDKACYHDTETKEIVCLDMESGKERWRAACPSPRGSRHSGGTLVMHGDVVLYTSAQGLVAFDAETGKQLWTGQRSSGPGITHPADLFVAGGLVWGGDPGTHRRDKTSIERVGREPKTGEVKKSITVPNLISPLHHYRCYRSKATDDYILLTKRGVEFVDLKGKNHMRNDWLRATCHYGFVPCNGLLYVPPHHCFCYPGVKLFGFNALAAKAEMPESTGPRLEKGPVFDDVQASKSKKTKKGKGAAWPTYRQNAKRSGAATSAIPAKLSEKWDVKLGGKVTPPVIADGQLIVAQCDAHRVCSLDAKTGGELWTFTAGGRIDSVPTIHRGTVLFGCRDGWVYCLRASDGELAWRFRAAPHERSIVSFEQVESVWPCHGSVLVLDNVVYCTAGRSSYLDGGVRIYGLDATSGKLLHEAVAEGPWPDVFDEKGRPFDMDGTRSDVLVTDGEHIHMLQMVYDKELNEVDTPRSSTLGDRETGLHLLATGGFTDDTWWDRNFWAYWGRWPGFYFTYAGPKAGQILVFDDETVYGLHVFTKRARLSSTFSPGDKGYELFADDVDNEPVLAKNSINREKGPGFSRAKPPRWQRMIPVRAQAMLLAGKTLFLAGPPDVVPKNDPYAAFDGRRGAKLWAVSTADGKTLAEHEIDELPAFDGMAGADGRLYLVTKCGKVLCFTGE